MDKNSLIYVAGHKGMVGSAIVRRLKDKGYNNILVRTHEEMDLKNQKSVYKFFEDEKPEYVFCAAAKVGGIKANKVYMADFLMDNLEMQSNLLAAAHKYKVKKLLFLASSCIYPKESEQPIKEEKLLTGKLESTNEGYALAKIVGLKACEYYKRQYGDNFICAMPANCYGINDSFDENNSHVIPALIKKFYNAKKNNEDKVEIWGSGKPLREFLYVDDLAEACIFLMKQYDEVDFINIGSGREVTIAELAVIIKHIVNYKGKIMFDVSKPDGMKRRMVDSSKINKLGWKSKVSLEDGIKAEYKWFLDSLCELNSNV